MDTLRRALLSLTMAALVVTSVGMLGNAIFPPSHPFIAKPALEQCYTEGTRLCAPTSVTSTDGWRVWDEQDGPSKLKVDPSRAFRVNFLGTAVDYPKLDGYDLALVGKDGKWYVFRAEPTS